MKQLFFVLVLFGLLIQSEAQETNTHWVIKTSSALDANCLLNTLTGDLYYRQYYTKEYDFWMKRINTSGDKSINSLYKMKTKRGIIISAYLTFMLGFNPDSTVKDLSKRFNSDFTSIKNQQKKFGTYNSLYWLYFKSYKKNLSEYYSLLNNAKYDSIYYQEIEPEIKYYIDSLSPKISSYNIIPYIEVFFGNKLQSDTITLYLLNYSQPHGISIGKNRYITYFKYDINIIINNAIHELLHEPVKNYIKGVEFIKGLETDTFIYNAFLKHDKNFGYNKFKDAIEESCVRFLDQVISERVGTAKSAKDRWKTDDKGMHVFAAILYQVYIESNDQKLTFKEILNKAIEQCKKNGGKYIYDELYSDNIHI
jgi:hypothetical protein